jgi:hypothetical protein
MSVVERKRYYMTNCSHGFWFFFYCRPPAAQSGNAGSMTLFFIFYVLKFSLSNNISGLMYLSSFLLCLCQSMSVVERKRYYMTNCSHGFWFFFYCRPPAAQSGNAGSMTLFFIFYVLKFSLSNNISGLMYLSHFEIIWRFDNSKKLSESSHFGSCSNATP